MSHVQVECFHRPALQHALRSLSLAALVLVLLTACASTAAAPRTEAERIAQHIRSQGADISNLRAVVLRGREGERVVENYGFDIPGITIENDKPAGTIRIYKGKQEAEAERHLYRLLGKPGPQTKLDYVTVVGTRGLILDHHLPEDVAKRYIDAFSSSP
jgi:hypothetical protein